MKSRLRSARVAFASRRPTAPAPAHKATRRVVETAIGGVEDGRLRVRGTAVDGLVVDAVTFRLRGRDGATITVPAAGARDFDVTAAMPEDVPHQSFSLDVRLHLRDADGVESVRQLNATPGQRTIAVSATRMIGDRPVWWYATRDGALSVRVSARRPSRIALDDTRVHRTPEGFAFTSRLTTVLADVSTARLQVTVRNTDYSVSLPIEVTGSDRAAVTLDETHEIHGTVDLAALLASDLPAEEHALDLSVVVDGDDGTLLRRGLSLADDPGAVRGLRPVTHTAGSMTHVLVPFLTYKAKNLSFARENFTEDAYRYLTRLRRLGPLWTLVRAFSGVWIIGETAYKAQDGGFHLFRWIRQHHPRRPVSYVIEADSPERSRVESLGRVLTMRSREHIRACFLARRFATTHRADFVLATSDHRAVRWMRGNRVFLQHGVLGIKNVTDTYGRLSPGFHTDYFHVSSPRERELVVNDLRYRPRQVRVAGLSRFDALLEPGPPPEGVLVIPTWRDWLLRPDAFEQSDFLQRWRAFLTSRPMRDAIDGGLAVTVILHPNMRYYGAAMQMPGVTVVQQAEADVQTLLRSHAALVTDYSSVGIDFSFLCRPVFYHQFDHDRMMDKRPPYLDLAADLPGDVFVHAEELAAAVVASWRGGFAQSPEHARRSAAFLAPADDRAWAERVYESVRTARSWRVPFRRLRDSAFGRQTYAWFRRSGVYEPAMSALSAVGRLLPRRDLAVFESNLARAAADSPRAIYDELIRRDTVPSAVWSTRDTFRPPDLRTRKVDPRSPAYFWYLSRARWWVNNQNFGAALKRPRGTTYVQTWHGTPLKRMQFDAVSNAGRKPGYLERMAHKTATWSVLLSPSPYATEAFRSAFRYDGPVLESGYPRNDVLVSDADRRGLRVRRSLGLSAADHVVLYAPTFRDDVKNGDQYAWDGVIDWSRLLTDLSEQTVVLVRRHTVVRGSLRIPPELEDRVRDVSHVPDVQDLLCAADVLVTDYSSVMFDYALLDRPIVLFCYDLEHYRDELRGFYFDLEAEAPGPIVRSAHELAAALADAQDGDPAHADARRRFRERFAPLDDGQAARRVVDDVFGTPVRDPRQPR